MVPTLLQFLTLLPEELTGNAKIPVTVSALRSNLHNLRIHLFDRMKSIGKGPPVFSPQMPNKS